MIQKFTIVLLLSIFLISCQEESHLKGRVQISMVGDQQRFTIDGAPYTIKGLSGLSHLKEAALIGANTIRTYDTTGLEAIQAIEYPHAT